MSRARTVVDKQSRQLLPPTFSFSGDQIQMLRLIKLLPAGAAHSMKASAQVTAPGAITSMIVAVSTRPNGQNRSIRSRMSVPLSTKAKVGGGKSEELTRSAQPPPTS